MSEMQINWAEFWAPICLLNGIRTLVSIFEFSKSYTDSLVSRPVGETEALVEVGAYKEDAMTPAAAAAADDNDDDDNVHERDSLRVRCAYFN